MTITYVVLSLYIVFYECYVYVLNFYNIETEIYLQLHSCLITSNQVDWSTIGFDSSANYVKDWLNSR
jgi:hypothetical protein